MVTEFDIFETNGQEEVGEVVWVWVLVGVCNVDGDRKARLVLILGHGENDEWFKLCCLMSGLVRMNEKRKE